MYLTNKLLKCDTAQIQKGELKMELKKVGTCKGYSLYMNTNPVEHEYKYCCYLPGESPKDLASPEWESDSLDDLKEWIKSA